MNREFFAEKRLELIEKLPNNSVLVLYSGKAPEWSGDQKYRFSINKNFYYVTGIEEENYIYVAEKRDVINEVIFIERDNDIRIIKFSGHKKSKEQIYDLTKIKNIKYVDEFEEVLEQSELEGYNVYLEFNRQNNEFYQKFKLKMGDMFENLKIIDINPMISEMRLKKESCEIENIKRAIEITKQGIMNMLKNTSKCMFENEIEAYYDYEIKSNGVFEKAFDSIVASGSNAAILHYEKNNAKLYEGDLVLVDLGVKVENYSSDISRTFPVRGKFSERQKTIYNIVLKAQKDTINGVKSGMTLRELNVITKNSFIQSCKQIGLINEDQEIENYYYHSVSHPLGLDTHDCREYANKIEEGMVITIEPGLYIQEEGIGIRIEDDILVTANSCEVLSESIPKEIDEIEEIMKK